MIKKGIIYFLYIQLFNYCIHKANCSKCIYRADSDPCILFSGVFEELEFSGAISNFESLSQARISHRNVACEKCAFGHKFKESCGMIRLSEEMFFTGILCGRNKKNDN